MQTVAAAAEMAGSQQREVADGADVVFTDGVQTVGRKTSWAKEVWANYFLGDRRLGDNSHFKKDVSPKDGWATGLCRTAFLLASINSTSSTIHHNVLLDAVVQRFTMAY